MSGFFKKLFNRIVGKTEEAPPPPPALEQLEAPAPVIVETMNSGRNEQFAQVKFEQSLSPGAIVKAHVIAANANYLEARLAA